MIQKHPAESLDTYYVMKKHGDHDWFVWLLGKESGSLNETRDSGSPRMRTLLAVPKSSVLRVRVVKR